MEKDMPETFVPEFHDAESVKKMVYNDLGKTGLKVSKLALGTAQMARYYDTDDEKECIDAVVKAVKSGINYIDTAPYYGEGKAEIVLGKALAKIPRKAYYIATKVGRYTSKVHTMFDFSARKIFLGMEETLKRLNLTYVDIIQIHDIEFSPTQDVFLKETLPSLQKFKECGIARFIGITGYPVQNLRELIEKSSVQIDTVLSYCRLTLFDQTLEEYIPYFEGKGIGVINGAVLGMGLLTPEGASPLHPAHSSLKKICREAAEYCKEEGVNITRLAASFALIQPGVATNIIGMPNLKHLDEGLEVLHDGLSMKECSVLTEIKEKFFKKVLKNHWESVEVHFYWKAIKERPS